MGELCLKNFLYRNYIVRQNNNVQFEGQIHWLCPIVELQTMLGLIKMVAQMLDYSSHNM